MLFPALLKTKGMLDYISSIQKGTCVNSFQQNQVYCLKQCNTQFTTLYVENAIVSISPSLLDYGGKKKNKTTHTNTHKSH